jgi:hypothetical protein
MIMPLVHNRAVLTTRRLQARPLSWRKSGRQGPVARRVCDVGATAGAERRATQEQTTSQLAELGKKSDAINRMKIELGEKNATICARSEKAVKEQLRATEEIRDQTSAARRRTNPDRKQNGLPRSILS